MQDFAGLPYYQGFVMRAIKVVAIILAIAFGVLFIPNLSIFDETLDPEITRRITALPSPPAQGNAALYLYGLPAADDQDPAAVGEAVIKLLQQKRAEGKTVNLSDEEHLAIYGGRDLDKDWLDRYDERCNVRKDKHCFAKQLALVKGNPVRDQRLIRQLDRYQDLIRQPHFIEDTRGMDFHSPLPDFHQIWLLGRITTAQAYLIGTRADFIAATQADMAFWRLVLRESQTLVGKMVAIAALQKNLLSISFMLKETPLLNDMETQAFTTILQPLAQDEIMIGEALTGDLRAGVENQLELLKYFSSDPSSRNLALALMEQTTASTNLYFKQTYLPVYNLSLLSAPEFYLSAQKPLTPLKFSRLNPYNLGGKIQLAQTGAIADYIGRSHNLSGMYSLVRMQLRAAISLQAREDLTDQDLQVTLEKLLTNPEFRNPYTQQPFDHDTAHRQISFNCYEARDRCAIHY